MVSVLSFSQSKASSQKEYSPLFFRPRTMCGRTVFGMAANDPRLLDVGRQANVVWNFRRSFPKGEISKPEHRAQRSEHGAQPIAAVVRSKLAFFATILFFTINCFQ